MLNFLYICKDYHIQPSEINQMPYYQYELYLEEIKAVQKQQSQMMKNMNPNSMMNSIGRNMPNMNIPKINVPKF